MPRSSFAGKAVGPDFRITGKRIGAGNFGEVFLGKVDTLKSVCEITLYSDTHSDDYFEITGENIHTNQRVAIKVEKEYQTKTAR